MRKSVPAWLLTLVMWACFMLNAPHCLGQLHFRVTQDTSLLVGHPAGPFFLDFQLNDGSSVGDGNNVVTLSNFMFGSGSVVGSPTTLGGASGSLASSVVIMDNALLNELFQEFAPGASLSFDVHLTANPDAASTPDQFSFAILDNTLSEIPTTGLGDALLLVDIDSATPSIQVFPGDPTRTPAGGGNGIPLPAPQIGPIGIVPEPGVVALLCASSLSGAGFWRRRIRKNH